MDGLEVQKTNKKFDDLVNKNFMSSSQLISD